MPYSRDTQQGFSQAYPLPQGATKDANGHAAGSRLHRRVPQVEYVRHLYMVPYMDTTVMDALVGKLNTAPFWGKAMDTLFNIWDLRFLLTQQCCTTLVRSCISRQGRNSASPPGIARPGRHHG